jgi:hypothetical protein
MGLDVEGANETEFDLIAEKIKTSNLRLDTDTQLDV